MKNLSAIVLVIILTGCGRQDDFYTVTKLIDIQDIIVVNQPFNFKLILRNDSLNTMKFTIDDTTLKSLFFGLDFLCEDTLIRADVENSMSEVHNYQEYYLNNGDSLVYKFQGLFRETKEGLQMEIKGYRRVYKIEKIDCKNLTINFGGMWIPGDFNPFDAMEGYNFNKKINVKFISSETGNSQSRLKK
jgi:hypothetical protein